MAGTLDSTARHGIEADHRARTRRPAVSSGVISSKTHRRRSRFGWCVSGMVGLMTVTTLTACKPALNANATQGSFTVGVITPDGADRYVFEERSTGLTLRAPAANTGGNLRLAVVKTNVPVRINQQSCVNWNGPADSIIQPGVVLRAKVEPDRTRAVMVTNNIWFGFRQGFNVHLVDTNGLNDSGTGPGSKVLVQLVGFDLEAGVGGLFDRKPLPWRICARVVGPKLTLKAWSVPSFGSEPSWSDPRYAKSVMLPQRSVYAGQPGIFVGHVKARENTHFNHLAAGPIPAPPTTTNPATIPTAPPPRPTTVPATTTPSTTIPAPTTAPPTTIPAPTTVPPTTIPAPTTVPPTSG